MSLTEVMLGAALVVQVDAPVAMKPVSAWRVDYADNGCVLSRDYGGSAATPSAALALKPLPLSQSSEMAVVTHEPGMPGDRRGRARVTLAPSGEQRDVAITRARGTDGRVTTRFDVDAAFLAALGKAEAVAVADGRVTTRLALGGAEKALAALTPCQDDLLRRWGLDPTLRDRIAKPAAPLGGGVAAWFSEDDYPFEANDANRQGRTTIAWKVDEKGRPGECRLLGSSGTRELDVMACAVIVRRGRFSPAIGTDGKPTASYQTRSIRWSTF